MVNESKFVFTIQHVQRYGRCIPIVRKAKVQWTRLLCKLNKVWASDSRPCFKPPRDLAVRIRLEIWINNKRMLHLCYYVSIAWMCIFRWKRRLFRILSEFATAIHSQKYKIGTLWNTTNMTESPNPTNENNIIIFAEVATSSQTLKRFDRMLVLNCCSNREKQN